MLSLYTTTLSANGRKVLAVSRHLGLSPREHDVDVYHGAGQAPAYLAINPSGKIPALVDGGFTLWESGAILIYLAEAHADCRLWSREPRRRADIARWLFWESAHWQPALSALLAERVGQLLFPERAGPRPALVRWDDPAFLRVAAQLDAHLDGRDTLVGDELTLADFAVAGMMTYARAVDFPFERHPQIAAWYARIEALEAWRSTLRAPWR